MRYLESLKPLLYMNLAVALCAAAQTASTFRIIKVNESLTLVSFIFFCTIALYAFPPYWNKVYTFIPGQGNARQQWIRKNLTLFTVFNVICGVLAAWLFFEYYLEYWQLFFYAGLVSVFYFVPIIKTGKKWKRLRDFGLAKPFLVAAIWFIITVSFPLQTLNDPRHVFEFANRFMLVYIIAFISDIKDIAIDKSMGVKTIPVRVGLRASKNITFILLAILLFVSLLTNGLNLVFLSDFIVSVWIGLVVYVLKESTSTYYYALWIDGILILQYFVILIVI